MSYNNIFPEIPDVVHLAVIDTLKKLDEKENLKSNNFKSNIFKSDNVKSLKKSLKTGESRIRRAAAVILIVLVASSITITASAAIKKYKLRFAEEMDQDKVDELYDLARFTDTLITSRELTEEECQNLNRLWKLYENNEQKPEKEIAFISQSEEYSGIGVAICTADGIAYIPDESLSDEEILELIDIEERMNYSIDIVNSYGYGTDYRIRFDELTDDEINSLYILANKNHGETSEGFSRKLSPDEENRYQKMNHDFEDNGALVEEAITIIDTAQDYDGNTVAYAAVDGKYMLPDREITDAELLQVIEMHHLFYYMFDRINREVDSGYREAFPPAQ